jgi:ABC-type nitrate/sulfonate/bicarbonate transport system substrate-binding protein
MCSRKAMRGALVAAAAALALGVAAAAGASPARVSSVKCRELTPALIPFAALEASYRKLTGLAPNTRLAKTQPQRYGICGTTRYAFALLVVAQGVKLTYRQQVAQQDHSPIWVQNAKGMWVDEGLDNLCKLAPAALIDLWKVGVKCK